MESPDTMTRSNTQLRRRNSITTSMVVPAKLTLPTKPHHAASFPNGTTGAVAGASTTSSSLTSSSRSFPSVDFELPLSYTSLRDLLPSAAAVPSPTSSVPGGGQSGYEISIRNRLVKQAAWAYLQPMSTSPESSDHHFLHRVWARISGDFLRNPVIDFLRFVTRTVTRAFDRFLRAIRVWSSR